MNKYAYSGDNPTEIKTKGGILIAVGFSRVVHGQRGAYVEIPDDLVVKNNLYVPEDKMWRGSKEYIKKVYYTEWRSTDNIKFYHQKKYVDYADYQPGMWYVSPRDLQDFETVGTYT